MLLTPSLAVTNCHTFSDLLPLERDVLYGRPLTRLGRPMQTIIKVFSIPPMICVHRQALATDASCTRRATKSWAEIEIDGHRTTKNTIA